MRTTSVLVLAVLALAVTACGGGGGEGASDGNVTPPPSTASLGSRAMPGSAITVTPETAIIPGQPASVLIAAPDMAPGATLTATVGDHRNTATPATITALPANQWRAAMTLPTPLPSGTCVLVTVTLANGSVLESGLEDFVLAH